MTTSNLGGFLRRLGRATTADDLAPLPDRQLVERFLAGPDEVAFRAILCRHGPMVYRACRRVLSDNQDAEDAFQVTFLVLARRAGSIRKRASLAGWLHGVAHQVALRLRTSSHRRRVREARAGRAVGPAVPEDLSWAEVRSVLDEELVRLPERLRAPLVLCYLEGRTQDEAARELGQTKSTFRRHLERGRELLGARLARRGVGLSAAFAAVLCSECVAAVPPGLVALPTTAGAVPARIAELASEVTRAMFLTKLRTAGLTLAAVLLGGAVGVAGLSRVAAHPGSPGTPTPAAAARAAGQPDDQLTRKTLLMKRAEAIKALRGRWVCQKAFSDDRPLGNYVTALRLVFRDDERMTLRRPLLGGTYPPERLYEDVELRYSINPTTKLAELTLYGTEGGLWQMVYELDGDELKTAVYESHSHERPRGFDPKDKRLTDIPLLVQVWKRQKD
ncbi:MAG TPA: sigma-70 family RNA polymerase sigma factor [Gemmataceae bacterium]|nr:sigma-70 family RNA polymerase sigma factor [Gemmataceae bacterium]